jgi:hypothetical protein
VYILLRNLELSCGLIGIIGDLKLKKDIVGFDFGMGTVVDTKKPWAGGAAII